MTEKVRDTGPGTVSLQRGGPLASLALFAHQSQTRP